MAVVCALRLLTSGGFQLTERLLPFRHPPASLAGADLSAHTQLNRRTNSFLKTTTKITKWQLGVSLSLTSAAALRAAADKLTPLIQQTKQGYQKVSQNFLGRGAATKQTCNAPTVALLKSAVCRDEKARRKRALR